MLLIKPDPILSCVVDIVAISLELVVVGHGYCCTCLYLDCHAVVRRREGLPKQFTPCLCAAGSQGANIIVRGETLIFAIPELTKHAFHELVII